VRITGGIFLVGLRDARFTLYTAMNAALGMTGIVVRAPVTKGRGCGTIVTTLVRRTRGVNVGLVLLMKGPHFEIISIVKFHVLIVVPLSTAEFVRVLVGLLFIRRNRCYQAAKYYQGYPKDAA
jgi:hypothetical protein